MERKWWTLIAVCVAIFMLLLDITVVNVALPDIQHSLHSSFADLQWVVDAYSLTLAAFLLTAGSLADLFGRRRVFVAGLVVFTLASAVCGLSTSPLMLNLARAVQGIGGAMMFATSLALIAQAFHGRERGTAFGVFGASTGAAVAVGPRARRGHHLGHRLGLDLLRQRPDRRRRGVRHAAQGRRVARPGRGRRRLGRPGHLLRRALPARVRARPGQRKGLGLDARSSRCSSAPSCCWSLFLVVELAQSRPMLDLSLFRRPAFTGASIVAFSLSALALRDVPLPDPLHPGRARLLAAPGRPALPADHAAVVRRRAVLRPAHRARAGAPAARLRPRARRRSACSR